MFGSPLARNQTVMSRRLLRSTVGLAIAAGIATAIAVAFLQTRSTARSTTPAGSSCVERLMRDWRDGRIDGTYPLPCYQQAITELPADVRVYSSAVEDIRQARANRIVQSADRSVRKPS
jgi:hypothetical protein